MPLSDGHGTVEVMPQTTYAPHTILVHGLGRSRFDMILLARRLSKLLPETKIHTFDYPSRKISLAQMTEELNDFVAQATKGAPVSFIGHSLGGIVVRALDQRGDTAAPLQRLVTLGSPHGGATIAAALCRYSPFRALFGPILTELGTLSLAETPRQLEIGCIVGALNSRFGFLPIFGEDNDGLVLVREAHLSSSRDSVQRAIFHGLFPFSAEAARLSATFLQHGSFEKSE